MIKVYVMQTCPDCTAVKQQLAGNTDYQLIDIGEHVKNLKEFLALRDHNTAFDAVKRKGGVGIPCFVKEDGTISFKPADFGLSAEAPTAPACSLDGKGC